MSARTTGKGAAFYATHKQSVPTAKGALKAGKTKAQATKSPQAHWSTCSAPIGVQKVSGCYNPATKAGGAALTKGIVRKSGKVASGQCSKCEHAQATGLKVSKVKATKTTKAATKAPRKTRKAATRKSA